MTADLLSDVGRETGETARTSPIFAFYIAATIAIAAGVGLMTFQSDLFPGMEGMIHFGQPSHRVHDLTFGFLFTTAVVGIIAQVRRPAANVAGMLMALIPGAALVLAAALSGDAGVLTMNPLRSAAALTVIVALLHPAGRAFFRSFSRSRIDWPMLGLVATAVVPLLALAESNIGQQRTTGNDHAAMGHYGFMAAFSFTVIGVALLAGLRPDGWRLTAWTAGLLLTLLGVTSLLYADADSSVGTLWAVAAVAWGAAFVIAAERSRSRTQPTQRATPVRGDQSPSVTST